MPDPRENRIVISAMDLARHSHAEDIPPHATPAIPWWARVIGWLLALSFPLLSVFALSVRFAVRKHETARRESWKGFLCTLLVVSGLTNLAAVIWFSLLHPGWPASERRLVNSPPMRDGLEITEPFPDFPSVDTMTPVEIAARTKSLVFIVTPDLGIDPQGDTLGITQIGAGVLLMAREDGFLVATNRHVIESGRFFNLGAKTDQAMVVSAHRQYARSRVIGRHRSLDLALLWVSRAGGSSRFRQSIAAYSSIPVGDPVFVIGHPQRLYFTLSNGLVSRVEDGALQLSAPISPGNSGGPVYDGHGNLLGIVTSKFDRAVTPNAENLNFATRADAFLDEGGWSFLDHGKDRLEQFRNLQADQ